MSYKKVQFSAKHPKSQQRGILENFRPVPERRKRHAARFCRRRSSDLTTLPLQIGFMEPIRKRFRRSSELHPTCFCRGNAFRLPLTDVCALVFGDKGQYLQHDIRKKRPHQILSASGVKKRHIQHYDIDSFILCQQAPLLQNFFIVSSKTVNAFDNKQIVFFLVF